LPPASGKVVFTLTQYPTILRTLDSDLAAHQAEHPTTAIQPLFPPLRRRTSRDRADHNGARQQTKEPPGYWKPAPSLARAPLAQACCLAGQPTVTMASLIPLINDLIPMIVPSSVSVTKATTLRPPNATLNPASANEADAVVSKSDKLCASDTILYMASGIGILLVSPGAGQDVKRHELSSGDFAFIPSWTEHQLLNESDQDTVWVITRSGSQPVTVGLTDWGGDRAK
ncbi:cupin, partial [Colletotrichum filicis]